MTKQLQILEITKARAPSAREEPARPTVAAAQQMMGSSNYYSLDRSKWDGQIDELNRQMQKLQN